MVTEYSVSKAELARESGLVSVHLRAGVEPQPPELEI
jgi:hypothetical protein